MTLFCNRLQYCVPPMLLSWSKAIKRKGARHNATAAIFGICTFGSAAPGGWSLRLQSSIQSATKVCSEPKKSNGVLSMKFLRYRLNEDPLDPPYAKASRHECFGWKPTIFLAFLLEKKVSFTPISPRTSTP